MDDVGTGRSRAWSIDQEPEEGRHARAARAGRGPDRGRVERFRVERLSTPPQVIPRPESHRPGDPARWSAAPAERRTGITLERVRDAVTHPNRPTLAPTGPLTKPEWD